MKEAYGIYIQVIPQNSYYVPILTIKERNEDQIQNTTEFIFINYTVLRRLTHC